jgi:hypothetical protein
MTNKHDLCPCRTGTAATTITIGTGGDISTTACAMLGIPVKVTTEDGRMIIVLCDSDEARGVGHALIAAADAVDSWYHAHEAGSLRLLDEQN